MPEKTTEVIARMNRSTTTLWPWRMCSIRSAESRPLFATGTTVRKASSPSLKSRSKLPRLRRHRCGRAVRRTLNPPGLRRLDRNKRDEDKTSGIVLAGDATPSEVRALDPEAHGLGLLVGVVAEGFSLQKFNQRSEKFVHASILLWGSDIRGPTAKNKPTTPDPKRNKVPSYWRPSPFSR